MDDYLDWFLGLVTLLLSSMVAQRPWLKSIDYDCFGKLLFVVAADRVTRFRCCFFRPEKKLPRITLLTIFCRRARFLMKELCELTLWRETKSAVLTALV